MAQIITEKDSHKTNGRLFTKELERLETIKIIRGFRPAERKRYEYLKKSLTNR